MIPDYTSLRSEWEARHESGERQERVMQHFVDRVCTGYNGLIHTHAVTYFNRLNAARGDAQRREEYIRGYRTCICKDGYVLRVDAAITEKELGDRRSPQQMQMMIVLRSLFPHRTLHEVLSNFRSPTFFCFVFPLSQFFLSIIFLVSSYECYRKT